MEPKTKKQRNRRTAVSPASNTVIDRRRALALGLAAAAVAVAPVAAVAEVIPTNPAAPTFLASARNAISLVDTWRRLGEDCDEIDATLKGMSSLARRASGALTRANDLPMERFRAALQADHALRSTLRMTTKDHKEAAIKDTLLLCLREMTGKEAPELRRELGLTA